MKINRFVFQFTLLAFVASTSVVAKRINEKIKITTDNNTRQSERRTQTLSFGVGLQYGISLIDSEASQCFSSHTVSEVKGRGKVTMNELQVGDKVLTASGKYDTIYSIDHRHPTKTTEFIRIYSESANAEEPIELTHRHMLFMYGSAHPVPACSVRVGDELQTLHGPSKVTKIDKVTRDGLFNILTTDGTIVASGILASSYSAYLSDNEWIHISGIKLISHQQFFDAVLKPYRFICISISLDLCKTQHEQTTFFRVSSDLYNRWRQMDDTFKFVTLVMFLVVVKLTSFIMTLNNLKLGSSFLLLSRWCNGESKKLKNI